MMRHLLWAFGCAALLGVGCGGEQKPIGDAGPSKKLGDPCQRASECGSSLTCAGDGTCQRPGSPGTGDREEGCSANSDCLINLVCTSRGKCGDPGTGGIGANCIGHDACQKGLLCSATQLCAEPGSPGTKAEHQECGGPTDCALGLLCFEKKCVKLSFFLGATCQQDAGALRSYFEIPRGAPLSDFYRLPFPNDIRKTVDGHIDVTTHPDPGVALPAPYNGVVKSYYDQIKADLTGFGVNTSVYFRFSGTIDFDSLVLSGDEPTVQFLDITKDSPGYGRGIGFLLGATTAGGKYICPNWMNVRPTVGQPLRAETTYAVLLRNHNGADTAGSRNKLKDKDDNAVARDNDFATVMAEAAPNDATLKRAWDAYAPLRAFLADQQIDPATVVNAAVFTTMDPMKRMKAVHGASVAAVKANPPELAEVTLCDEGATSPCDDGTSERSCPESADGRFFELHATYQTPVFQVGTPPYLFPADGGAIAYDAEGVPQKDRDETVCMAMSVPKGSMPAAGWPVVVFAHGTGGNFRSFINNGLAAALADIQDGAGQPLAKAIVVGIDASMHGPRRGETDQSSDRLFFNLLNPKSARDNVYQGVADAAVLVQLLKGLHLSAATVPAAGEIKVDPTRIYFFGHSQGSITGVPLLAFDPEIKAGVLSGAGGYLIGSLLNKKKPFDVTALVQLALADGAVNSSHPLLNMLQFYFEEVDGLNYGRAVAVDPPAGVPSKHVFLSYGVADSYTPPATTEILGRVMGLPLATRCGDGVCTGDEDCNSCAADCPAAKCEEKDKTFNPVAMPVKGNLGGSAAKVTGAVVRYAGDGSYDDHFVLFQNPLGQAASAYFLGTAARDGVPTIDELPAK